MMKPLRTLAVLGVGLLSAIYLVNPGAGIFELIPDNVPLLGNLDEAGATALLLACLRYFGFDPISLFKRERRAAPTAEPVIDVEGRRVP